MIGLALIVAVATLAVGTVAATSFRMFAGTASNCAFASDMASATAPSRSAGSARLVGRAASMTEI